MYIISDTHFNHDKMAKLRNFSTSYEMDNFIIENWNSVVGVDDIVYHLGDFSFRLSDERIADLVERLNGHIVLILGNHDRIGKTRLLNIGFKEVLNSKTINCLNKKIKLSHRPIKEEDLIDYDLNIHGHTHNYILEDKKYVNVSVEVIGYTPISLENLVGNIVLEDNIYY